MVGHGEAYDYMLSMMKKNMLSIDEIMHMHRLLIGREDPEIVGKYKAEENMISGSMYTTIPIRMLDKEMNRLEVWMKAYENNIHPLVYYNC